MRFASALVALPALLLLSVPPAHAQDGKALLQRMADTYKNLNSYDGRANVELMLQSQGKTAGQPVAQSSTLKLKRPNRLYLEVSRGQGSAKVYSDGSHFVCYIPSTNIYVKTDAAPDIAQTLDLMKRLEIQTVFDPLYFLGNRPLPPQLTALQVRPDTTMNGHPVRVVTGHILLKLLPLAPLEKLLTVPKQARVVPPPYATLTWYIDRSTFLLQRMEIQENYTLKAQLKQNNKPVVKTLPVTLFLRHTIVQATGNANLPEPTFIFVPPPNSQEKTMPTGKTLPK